MDIRVLRAKALYEEDELKEFRKSHENPLIVKLYEDFLGKPNSHKAHKLLHTHYVTREKYPLVEHFETEHLAEAASTEEKFK